MFLVTFGLLLQLLTLHYSVTAEITLKDQLADCLDDKDYEKLLQTAKSGLPYITGTHHVAIVGAGMAGLTAAKLLKDAGHTVHMTQKYYV